MTKWELRAAPPRTIADKDAFKRIQSAGLLGNYFRMWDTVSAVADADYHGCLTVRSKQASDKALFIPVVHSDAVWQDGDYLAINEHPAIGGYRLHSKMSDVYLQECPAPDAGRIINLEASMGHAGAIGSARDGLLYVKYALNDPTNLRHSLEQNGQEATGIEAINVLRRFLQEDRTQLYDIWDKYPDAVIEASRFTKRVGVFDSQTIIWECRDF